jgi:hypothetical protein
MLYELSEDETIAWAKENLEGDLLRRNIRNKCKSTAIKSNQNVTIFSFDGNVLTVVTPDDDSDGAFI